jgi:hypothetical protein
MLPNIIQTAHMAERAEKNAELLLKRQAIKTVPVPKKVETPNLFPDS